MLNVFLMLIILFLISITYYFSFKPESFQTQSTCNFFPENDPLVTNSTECYNRCLSYYMANPSNNHGCIDQVSSDNCIQKCQNFIPSSLSANGEILPQHCNISQNDIYGPNIRSCITNCENYGGNVCKKYKVLNLDGSVMAEGNYNIASDPSQDYTDNCDLNDPNTFQHCSPCVQKCMSCNDTCKCTWLDDVNNIPCGQLSLEDTDINFDKFNFTIRAIPENQRIILVWDIDKNNYNIKEFLIMINKKDTSDVVKTIRKKFNNVAGNFTHRIENLSNNIPYIINVTAISNNNRVKMSNTLEVTPSEVNIINFSQLSQSNKMKNSVSTNLFENIMGKTFEINF